MLRLLAAAAFVASVSVSCSEVSFIEINPPADLQSKIDSIQAVKDAANALLGDKTPIEIEVAIVGNEDCSTGWDGAKSQDFTIPAKKKLTLKFINHGSKANNWNNWNLRVKDASDKEVFLLRSDNYALVSNDPNAVPTMDMPDIPEGADYWGYFIEKMDGASVVMTIDHSMAGEAIVEVVATATDGSVIMNHYKHAVSATEDIKACLVCDGSWFDMKEAFLSPSDVAEIIDYDAIAISVSGTPASIEVGSTDFWGKGVATVTYADNTSFPVDTADVNFVVPDLSTPGVKTILYSYSKTKEGAYGPSVAGYYTLEVTNPVVALEASASAYLIGGAKYVTLSPGAVKVIAEFGDGSKAPLTTSQFTVAFTEDKIVYEGTPGTYEDAFTVTYKSASGKEITAEGDFVIAASEHAAQDPKLVGLEDNSTPWWAHFSKDWTIAPYTSQTVSMKLYSKAEANYQGPSVVLRKADNSEYGVLRLDHWGWGASVGEGCPLITATSNWNWDTYLTNLNNSDVAVTITNNGDNTASVRYHIVHANGETHFQHYDGIEIDSTDFQFAIVVDSSHLIFD